MKCLNTKIRNLFDKLKDKYGITVGTNHMQCVEPPNTIVKFENCNRIPIKNCTPVYQMQLHNVGSALIMGMRTFVFLRWTISSDSIYYLLWNQCELHLNDKDTDKENGPQFIWTYFNWSILRCEDIHNYYNSEFIWNFFFWNEANGVLTRLY